jgi:hypothetical protein
MPRGPKGEKRPVDVIGAAIRVAKIATGEEKDEIDIRDPAAVERGRKGGSIGGATRKRALSPERRKEIALTAAKARWKANSQP